MQVKFHNFFTGKLYFFECENYLYLHMCSLIASLYVNIRLPSNDGNASKGKQQTSEPVHILKRSFARTVSVVSVVCIYYLSLLTPNSMQYLVYSLTVFICLCKGMFWLLAEYSSLELDNFGVGCGGAERTQGLSVHSNLAGPGETLFCWHMLPSPPQSLHLWDLPHCWWGHSKINKPVLK